MAPRQFFDIETEIRETEALEGASAVTNLPNTLVRNVTLFDQSDNHTDSGVDVVVDVDVDIDDDILAAIDVDIDVDVDVDTHVDQ